MRWSDRWGGARDGVEGSIELSKGWGSADDEIKRGMVLSKV